MIPLVGWKALEVNNLELGPYLNHWDDLVGDHVIGKLLEITRSYNVYKLFILHFINDHTF